MRFRVPAAALAALALPLSSPAAQAPAGPALAVEPCQVPGVAGAARCGTLEVWENRETKSGRKIRLGFIVIPATGGAPAREALVPLGGGPGQAATGMTWVAEEWAGARGTRDVLLVDHRGVGRSHLVQCERFGALDDLQSVLDAPFFPVERVRACAERHRDSADVRFYTSMDFADDLEELRAALGYEKLSLWGGSYGTRTALEMMRRHPGSVRAAVLQGVAPTDARHPMFAARIAQEVLEGIFAECAAEAACRAAFPDPKGDLERAMARFAAGPVEAEVPDPRTGEAVRVRLSRELFGEGLRFLTYGSAGASMVPAVLRQAAEGDFGPITEYTLWARRSVVGGSETSHGLFLSVTCAEDIAFIDLAEAERAAEGTYLGAERVRNQVDACAAWPTRALPRTVMEPVTANVPTLLISGELDPATPAAFGERTARSLPNARSVVLPSAGHWLNGLVGAPQCVRRMITDFFRDADPRGLDTGCVDAIRRPPFPTGRFSTRRVAIPADELARYAGRYGGEGEGVVELKVEGDRLRAHTPEGPAWSLVPVGRGRFRTLDEPFVYVVFAVEDGAVKRLAVERGGATTLTLRRVE